MKPIACFAMLAAGMLLNAASTDFPADTKNWAVPATAIQDGKIALKGKTTFNSRKRFAVDPGKSYTLSLSASRPAAAKDSNFAIGFLPLDKNGKAFYVVNVNTVRNSHTELTAPCNPGDKTLQVKDASKWRSDISYWVPAFDAETDFSDLPNRNVEQTSIEKIEKKEGYDLVTFKKPFTKFHPAGSGVRLHSDGGIMYCVNGTAQEKPVTVSGKMQGLSTEKIENGKWWPGTAVAYIYGYTNTPNTPNAELVLSDIKVTEE